MPFYTSPIYLRTLAPQADAFEPQRTHLRDAFLRAHENAEFLLAKIHTDFPNLTIHDITHVDGLWDVASVICGNNFPINPLEGFVLGCAFLIHDAALSYDAVGGKAKLQSTAIWKDAYFDACRNSELHTDDVKEKEADFNAIRTLHAKYAGSSLTQLFTRPDGSTFYIIEDESLRNDLQRTIGEIAESHHWNIDRVKAMSTQTNAPTGYSRDWRINPQKLACILRCADAGHIDAGRAPDYMFRLLKLNGVSLNHWRAQTKLAMVDIDTSNNHRAIITSNQDFNESDFAAWNVASAAVKVFDTEIKSANRLLKTMPQPCSFQVEEVAGADSVEELSRYIKTVGWEPCEANIRVSDVVGIIKKLGGEALYGKEDHILIAIRELIQNARDAIHARQFVDKTFTEGRICVSVQTTADGIVLKVSDNGIGMSLDVIKNAFLNFGESYWASSLAKKEFPGLRSSGFAPVGKYGIGFYSVFMIASSVIVETRRYNAALKDAILLKFPNGLTLNPIKATCNGSGMNISTVVTLIIPTSKFAWNGQYEIKRNKAGEKSFKVPFRKALSALTAGVDVDVFYQENGRDKVRVHQNINAPDFDIRQWLIDISFAEEQNNGSLIKYIDNHYRDLQRIEDGGRFVGIAAIAVHNFHSQIFLNISTVGGLATSIHFRSGERFIGLFDSLPSAANRNGEDMMKTNGEAIKKWGEEQYEKIKRIPLDQLPIECQASLSEFNVDPIDIVRVCLFPQTGNPGYYTLDALMQLLNGGARIVIALAAFGNNHMEVYIDIEKMLARLEQNDYYLFPYYNSSFLDIHETIDANDFTLYGCIIRIAKMSGIDLNIEKKTGYVMGKFGFCDALIISKR